MKVISKPILKIETVDTRDTICNGGHVAFRATVDGVENNNGTYTWYKNGVVMNGCITNSISDDPIVANTGDVIYAVRFVQNGTGCDTTVTDTIYVIKNINVEIALNGTPSQYLCDSSETKISLKTNVTADGGVLPTSYHCYDSLARMVISAVTF